MDKRDALRKELESMAEKQKALERELAMMDEEEKEKESGNKNRGIDFSGLHVWLRNYSFDNHFMKDREGKEDYIRLLILTALMMQPYTEHLDEGLALIEQVQNVLGGQGVEELMTEVMEIDRKSMEKVIASVLKNQGAQSFLIDSLLLYGEMKKGEDKAEVTRQLSALYNLLGADGQLIAEAADAVSFIEKGDKEGLLEAAGAWEELDPVLPKAYLGIKELKTAYTAVWPKRLDDVDADTCPAYANNLILKTMVNEGDAVDEGDILFVIYGGKQRGKRDIDKSHEYGTYGEKDCRVYTFDALYYDNQKNWMYVGIEGEEADSSALRIDENYEKIVVKAECRGIVHYSDDICALPFQDIISSWRDIRRSVWIVYLGSQSYDPHINALNESTAQPVVSKDEYYRSGSLLSLGNVSSSVICTITPVK